MCGCVHEREERVKREKRERERRARDSERERERCMVPDGCREAGRQEEGLGRREGNGCFQWM